MGFQKVLTVFVLALAAAASGTEIPDGSYKLISSEQRAVAGSTVYPREFSPPENYVWEIKSLGNERYSVVKTGVGNFVGEGAMFVESSCGAEPDAFEVYVPHANAFNPTYVKDGVFGFRAKCPEFFFSKPDSTTYNITGAGPGQLKVSFFFNFENYYVIQMFVFKKI